MKKVTWLALLVGLAAITLLVVWQGIGAVWRLIEETGWGILVIAIFAIPEQLLNGQAWRLLFPPADKVRTRFYLYASWLGSSVNTLLPVASIGGEVVKTRLVALAGVPMAEASAVLFVDKTVQALTVLLWGLIGIALLFALAPESELLYPVFIGTLLLALGIAGFILVQLAGTFAFFARIGARVRRSERWQDISEGAGNLDLAIRNAYRRQKGLISGLLLRSLARLISVFELVLVAYFMGQEIGLLEAAMVRALVIAIRGAAFAVPSGLGVQEGGYVLAGAIVGLPPDLMLAVALVTRLRETLPAIPGIILWQHYEGRRFLDKTIAGGQEKA